jgi:hypothetical protein
MGYMRQQFQARQKCLSRVRHARVSLCVVRCAHCSCKLPTTHLVQRFGELCRLCWSASRASGDGSDLVGVSSGGGL